MFSLIERVAPDQPGGQDHSGKRNDRHNRLEAPQGRLGLRLVGDIPDDAQQHAEQRPVETKCKLLGQIQT